MTAQCRSKGHLLTTAVIKIRRTRAERLLLLYTEIGHENILVGEEISITEEKYNNQDNKIIAQMSLEVSSGCAGRPLHNLRNGKLSNQGVTFSFLREMCKMGA